MPTTTLKPKTTKGGSATKLSLTNASAEKSRKMLEQMLAKKLSSSTKVPKTMTIKTGATKKSTASAGATKGRKGGRRGGAEPGVPAAEEAAPEENQEDNAEGDGQVKAATVNAAPAETPAEEGADSSRWKTATTALAAAKALEPTANSKEIPKSMTFKCDRIDDSQPPAGGYRKKRTYVKKSSCAMSSKRPMSAKPTKKSSCGASAMSSKRPMSAKSTRPKTAKK